MTTETDDCDAAYNEGFEKGYSLGWRRRGEYIADRVELNNRRSILGEVMMLAGSMMLAGIVMMVSTAPYEQVVWSNAAILSAVMAAIVITGFFVNRRERRQDRERQEEFNRKWIDQ